MPSLASGQRLRPDVDLHYLSDACQAWVQRVGLCESCRRACPVDALLWVDERLALLPDCLSCGRCIPVCPMGALELPGLVQRLGAQEDVLRVDCRRVPLALRAGVSVPCLGALDAAALLELAASGQPIELLDRGWCAECPANGGERSQAFPAQAALQQASDLLSQRGWPAASHPRRVSLPLPLEVALPMPSAREASPCMTRRGFFGRLAKPIREVATQHEETAPPPRPPVAAPPHASLARARLLAALDALPMKGLGDDKTVTSPSVPSALTVELQIGPECRNHQGCTKVCPTGALQPYQDHVDGFEVGGVRFNMRLCLDCGLCLRHCPEQSLVRNTSDAKTSEGWVVLTRHVNRRCVDCGGSYSVAAGQVDSGRCDPCEKSRRLAREMFHQFFAAQS